MFQESMHQCYSDQSRISIHGERDRLMQGTCTQASRTHDLDGQHQDVDRTTHGRVN